jgi:hypothetical protein
MSTWWKSVIDARTMQHRRVIVLDFPYPFLTLRRVTEMFDMTSDEQDQAEPLTGLPEERISDSILILRGHRVLLDTELAALYGTTTKRLNEQVKHNAKRFPEDFSFRMSAAAVETLNRSQFATGSQQHRNPRFPP